MAQITRSTKVSGGTTLVSSTSARAADVETDMLTVYNAHNTHDSGTSKWQVVSSLNAASVPLVADNSTGSQDVADFKVNGTTKVSVTSTGVLTTANGITNSGAAIAVGTQKITGLSNGTASTDAAAFGQIKYLQAVQTASSTQTSITSSTFTAATNQSVVITPTSASNRVKITVSTMIGLSGAITGFVTIKRGVTELSNLASGFWTKNCAVAGGENIGVAFSFIDSPATTSATTYQVFFKNSDNATTILCGSATLLSVIMAEEIV